MENASLTPVHRYPAVTRPPGTAPYEQDRAPIDAHLDQLAEKHEQPEVGVAVAERQPPDSSTVAAIVEGLDIVRVESLTHMNTAIDIGDGRDVRSS